MRLMDCTHRCSNRRRLRGLAISLATGGLALAGHAGVALADGDPASDVLASAPLFLPQDAGVPPGEQAQLTGLLGAGLQRGYVLRVAIVSSPSDLGSVAALWRQPATYARFLWQELSLVYRGPLLVVMPNGYGYVGGTGAEAAAAQETVRGLGPAQRDLGAASLAAIERLASASGHSLPKPAAAVPAVRGSPDTISWVVVGLGVALTAIAWIVSLRARPLRLRFTHDVRSSTSE